MKRALPGKIDATLICQLQGQIAKNSQKALKELYGLFFARLYNFALMYVNTKEVAEELVNDVMVKIWNNRNTITDIRNLETYLFVAVRNHAFNYLSTYSNFHVAIESEGNQARVINLTDPSKDLEWKEISFQLEKAVDTLPDQCRTVFKLIREEGFKYKQVAEILNISPRTVETQLFRAIKKLDKIIQTYEAKSISRAPRSKF
ncbi:MAG: RNA polymerase sigma-70 factor [Sphingobacteriales bacterium]|nr:MAG: RNA polymerase sigma-70 factor [Sphingobacteriales bacterium]